MITKEVLAKVNDIIAVAVTKHRTNINIECYELSTILTIGQIQEDFSSLYRDGSKYSSDNWIYLTKPNALDQLEQALQWLHTLENRDELRNMQ